jgi:transposase-like protein
MKEMDRTFRAVRVVSDALPKHGILISELDGIYYMATSVFGYEMKHITCSYCGYAHLDRDWFSVHAHRRHLCAGCGKHFRDNETAIGNPILGVRDACGINTRKPKPSSRKLDIKQAEFPGGIQIWGSNAAFLWTRGRAEEEGIHVHAFKESGAKPHCDETYGEVIIDGVKLDASMVRILMAQSALPSLKSRIMPIDCPSCHAAQFGVGELAFTPTAMHRCNRCGNEFAAPGRLRKTIANPLVRILAQLANNAPRPPQN